MSVKIAVLGGLGEIGMNCLAIETDREMILVDCGLLFSDLDNFGVDYCIPNFKYVLDRKDKLKAIFATHGHEDHIGAIPYLVKQGAHVPIYSSPFTARLIEERLHDHGVTHLVNQMVFQPKEKISFQEIKVTPFPVNHSIVEASAFLIETPAGKILHTGDFKMDESPYYGEPINLDDFKKLGDEGVLLLLSDSTNIEVEDHSLSEKWIYHKFEEIFAAAKGMIVVSTFASNISRMGQVFELAKNLGKRVAVTGRSMQSNLEHSLDSGFLEHAEKILIDIDEMDRVSRNRLVVLSTGSQGEMGSALHRISAGEHKEVQVQDGDTVVLSSKFIPGNEVAISKVINQLFRQGAEVLYDAIHDVHVSGHAAKPELKKMLETVRPRYFVPVHGEYRHLVHHAALAKEVGMKDENVLIASNGEVFSISGDGFEMLDKYEDFRILVESETYVELKKDVLKQRRKLAEGGCIIVLVSREKSSFKILSGPQVLTKGVVSSERETWLITECQKVAKSILRSDSDLDPEEIQENIRIELRRHLKNILGKKVEVIAIMIEV